MKIWATLGVALAALALAVAWDLGYGFLSLESVYAAMLALTLSLPLALVASRWTWLVLLVLAVVVAAMLDVFVVEQDLWAWLLYGGLLVGALLSRRWVQDAFFVVFAVVMLAGVALHGRPRPIVPIEVSAAQAGSEGPVVVHLILDEMGSWPSVPASPAMERDIADLRQEYEKRGFQLFEGYPSSAPYTQFSMSDLLSTSPQPMLLPVKPKEQLNFKAGQGQFKYRLIRNEMMDLYASKGWDVSVMQSDFIELCVSDRFKCGSYTRGNHVEEYARSGAGWGSRWELLVFEAVTSLSGKGRGLTPLRWLSTVWPALTAGIRNIRSSYASRTVGMLRVLELEKERLKVAPGRSVAQIHLLMPHYPWVVDRRCVLRPKNEWRVPQWYGGAGADQDSVIQAYWEQNLCAHQRVLSMVDELDRARPGQYRFVMHGDHGSRISGKHGLGNLIRMLNKPDVEPAVTRSLLEPFIAIRAQGVKVEPAVPGVSMQNLLRPYLMQLADLP